MVPYRVYFELGDGRLVEYRRSGRYLPVRGRQGAPMSIWRALVVYSLYAVFIGLDRGYSLLLFLARWKRQLVMSVAKVKAGAKLARYRACLPR